MLVGFADALAPTRLSGIVANLQVRRGQHVIPERVAPHNQVGIPAERGAERSLEADLMCARAILPTLQRTEDE